jgi:IMP dehydrogenase
MLPRLQPAFTPARAPHASFLEPFAAIRPPLIKQQCQAAGSRTGYCGAKNIEDLRAKAQFCRVTGASMAESHPHDIHITKEAPNYSVEYASET